MTVAYSDDGGTVAPAIWHGTRQRDHIAVLQRVLGLDAAVQPRRHIAAIDKGKVNVGRRNPQIPQEVAQSAARRQLQPLYAPAAVDWLL